MNFGSKGKRKSNGLNGLSHDDDEDDDEDDDFLALQHDDINSLDLLEESLQMVDTLPGTSPLREPEELPLEEEEESIVQKSVAKKKGRGRPAKAAVMEEEPEEPPAAEEEPEEEAEEEPIRRRGRPAKKNAQEAQPEPSQSSRKRRSLRNSLGEEAEQEEEEEEPEESAPQPKRQRTKAPAESKPAQAKAAKSKAGPAPKVPVKPKGRPGRKAKADVGDAQDAGETSFAALQRGPPMPKRRGLVSVQRDPGVMTQTRSGRHSFKPLQFWRGEQIVQEEEVQDDMFGRGGFVLPSIKEVIRVPEDTPPPKRGSKSKGRGKGKPSKSSSRPEEEPEEWEVSAGTVSGEIVIWEPEHEVHPPADDEPVQIAEEQIAISGDAIQTRDIRDATFRFAKTLTMPFMGAGVVDLPPGSAKRPKNSRKMHMVFFVHYGKVLVTVNEAQFRITAGGMWFVPRGMSSHSL